MEKRGFLWDKLYCYYHRLLCHLYVRGAIGHGARAFRKFYFAVLNAKIYSAVIHTHLYGWNVRGEVSIKMIIIFYIFIDNQFRT